MIIPSSKYPSQTAVDLTNYPQGKARNVTASGDGTGTPLEKDWLNDWFGFQQAAILAAGITPSGTPDTALASDLLNALVRPIAAYQIGASTFNTGARFPLTALFSSGGTFALSSNSIFVPRIGKYRVGFNGRATSSATANPQIVAAEIQFNGFSINLAGSQTRFSASPTDSVGLFAEGLIDVTVPGTQGIALHSLATGVGFQTVSTVWIERVG